MSTWSFKSLQIYPFVLEDLVHTKTFFTLLLGVVYSVSKSESSSSSEVRNYDHHRWETNKHTIMVGVGIFYFCAISRQLISKIRFPHPISVADAVFGTRFDLRDSKRRALEN